MAALITEGPERSTSSIKLSREHERYFTNPFLRNFKDYQGLVTKEWILHQIAQVSEMLVRRDISDEEFNESCVYTGIPGVVYALMKVIRRTQVRDPKRLFDICEEYMKVQMQMIENTPFKYAFRYLVGTLGIYVVKAIMNEYSQKPNDSIMREIFDLGENSKNDKKTEDEIMNGKAGFLAALVTLELETGITPCSRGEIKHITQGLIQAGRAYAQSTGAPIPLLYKWHKDEYLGAAHGLGGILQMLMSYWDYLDNGAKADVMETMEYMLNIRTKTNNLPSSTKRIGQQYDHEELVHWCHGAGGAIYMYIVAYITTKQPKFLQAARDCANLIWERGILHKGPGLCHGVSGNGYAFLMMYRLTHEEEYLAKAKMFALAMMTDDFKNKARRPDRPYSLFEGWAGALCFLSDLLEPDQAQFPMIPIYFHQ